MAVGRRGGAVVVVVVVVVVAVVAGLAVVAILAIGSATFKRPELLKSSEVGA